MNETNTEPRTRVLHVPLTDAQWKALGVEAVMSDQTKGEVTARALVQAIPRIGGAT
jgi:hypothetical protein